MLIIERAKGQRNIEGSETTVNVEIPIVFADTAHSRFRQDTREMSKEQAIELVKQKLPEIMETLTSGELVKNGEEFVFCVIDKQTCAVVGCTMKSSLTLKQKIIIRTVYFFDRYHSILTKGNIFYVNEDNPSPEWEEAVYYSEAYSDVYKDYREYEKQFDPEHPENKPYRNKDWQEASMWYNYGPGKDDFNRLGGRYSNALKDQQHQDYEHAKENGMNMALSTANKAADNQILTKRGPNGTLRGIDRRRKAAERKMNKAIQEQIKRLKEYEKLD